MDLKIETSYRSEEDKRRRRQQARVDNEKRKNVKRMQSDKPPKLGPYLGVEANKENDRPSHNERWGRSPTTDEIAVAEQMEVKNVVFFKYQSRKLKVL